MFVIDKFMDLVCKTMSTAFVVLEQCIVSSLLQFLRIELVFFAQKIIFGSNDQRRREILYILRVDGRGKRMMGILSFCQIPCVLFAHKILQSDEDFIGGHFSFLARVGSQIKRRVIKNLIHE